MSEASQIDEPIGMFDAGDGIPPAFSGTMEEAQQIERPKPKMPADIAEESGISGLLLATQMWELLDVPEIELTEDMCLGLVDCPYIEDARALAPQIEGAPVLPGTLIRIKIGEEREAGSEADCIWVTFGTENRVTFSLLGEATYKFLPGYTMEWWLDRDYRPYAERIPTDGWDEITLRNPFDDPMRIEHILIGHSGVPIMDSKCYYWLDRDKGRQYSKLGLGVDILNKKLLTVYNSHIPQLHWAALELGKTDGRKYGATDAWSSEFASWCLRKGLWGTPTGAIDSEAMEAHFDRYGRKYTKQQVLDGDYVLTPGDYLRYRFPQSNGYRSALFIRYLGDSDHPDDSTMIEVIEGNTAGRVAVLGRSLANLCSVGSTC